MGKKRENIDLVADILKAACCGSGKTRILNLANLSYKLLEKYLKIVLEAGFLKLEDSTYKITERGQQFIEKYDELKQRELEAQELLRKSFIERKEMKHLLQNGISPLREQNELVAPINNEAFKVCCSFQRIDGSKFYCELKILGFKPEEAEQIVSWIDIINSSRPVFFSGKKASLIKTNLAYIGARIFNSPRRLTRRIIAQYYGTSGYSMQRSFKEYLTILYEEKSDVFKLRTITSKKQTQNQQASGLGI